jgi:ABC-type Na+ efflux pump permease subunit
MNRKKLNVKAIVTGWLFTVIGSTAFAITAYSLSLIIISLIFNLLLTLLGGYLISSITKELEIKNTLVMGFLAELGGLFLLIVVKPNSLSLWYHLVSLAFIIPFALFGSYLYLILEKNYNHK